MNNILQDKRILVTGITGQVGGALKSTLSGHCELVTAARSGADVQLDLANIDQIVQVIDEVRPDIIINPAAYTQVDQAEDEPELARLINAEAVGVLAEQCKKKDSLLVHYSTDYVFNGSATKPYSEEHPTNPINVYGQTKLQGEQAIQAVDCDHLIFRTCWVYDAYGKNFPNAILQRARTMETLKVVDDQQGTPTWAGFIADATRQAIVQSLQQGVHSSGTSRLYNLKPDGTATWYEFASAIINHANESEELMVREILPVSSNEFPTKAARPKWSVLDSSKLKADFNLKPDQWHQYIKQCFTAA